MTELKWWQQAVFYQIYPRSFADSDGDGIGDLPGIISRLDYLRDLGVDAIWLSPHYPSPQADCGYDIADYTGVAPEYGTLDDFRRFLYGAHQRGLRVILDLVLNHTSDQHPWFIESRASRDNPRRDWYVWRDGKGDGPPNNWLSAFGGSAWEYDPATGQYYYHAFLKQQPDLNWRNPQVKGAMFDAARFWLDLGVDGFRLDAIGTIYEDPALPDHTSPFSLQELRRRLWEEPDADARERLTEALHEMFQHQWDRDEVHRLMRELRALVDAYEDCVLVGETDDVAYHGQGDDELHMVFNFPLTRTDRLTPNWVRANQRERLAALPPGAWPCNTLGNHDSSRVYSRYGDGENDAALAPQSPNAGLARISLALMLTLRGTPFLYNGEEIGMTDLALKDIAQFRDPWGVWMCRTQIEELGIPPGEALATAARFTRDGCRTPMQWANAPNAGFSPPDVETWLPVNPNYAEGVNVADQSADRHSLLEFYRLLLHVRRETPALVGGDYTPLHPDAEDYLAFLRQLPDGSQSCLVVLNMSERSHRLGFDLPVTAARTLFSSHQPDGQVVDLSDLSIASFEIFIAEL
jgi:alpha-glucosidase